ncbi:MAG: hypothetical protein AAB473_01770 [Patescibacteria group bacterium]
MKNENTKIELDDFGCRCYEFLLKNKEFRVAHSLKVLILRNDFQGLLFHLDAHYLKMRKGLSYPLCEKDEDVSDVIRKYLDRVVLGNYFKNVTENEKEYFVKTASQIIEHLYFEHSMDIKSFPSFSLEFEIWSKEFAYPNISNTISFKTDVTSRKVNQILRFTPEELKADIAKSLEILAATPIKLPGSELFPSLKLPITEPKELAPKVCELVFDDTTEKEELLGYIEKNWDSISLCLKAGRSIPEGKRMSADRNFLRNVRIYNQYQVFKTAGKNPDVKLQTWLSRPENGGLKIDAGTIRQIVSEISCGLVEINA